MKKLILLSAVLLTFTSCILFKSVPTYQYSIEGDVTFVNNCNDSPPPSSINVPMRLYYGGSQFASLETVLVINLNGGQAHYKLTDATSNVKATLWEIDFPESCSPYICRSSICENRGTNTGGTIIVTGENTTYNYQYNCQCR